MEIINEINKNFKERLIGNPASPRSPTLIYEYISVSLILRYIKRLSGINSGEPDVFESDLLITV
ncbi:hypothetical protein [Ruminococcus sp. HUN007]|uniref:hypothetical protein n=1 Tax=Ruminococcus sp. HUN007 TaxID=1514668 RepID=UPI0005D13587|nr:hypothetical protein [Ruminococcus sp. HUN007]